MTSSSSAEIRHELLQFLYSFAQANPSFSFPRNLLQRLFQIPKNKMDFNMLYLEQKRLVKLLKSMGSLWDSAEITALGIDVVEDKDKFGQQFPFIQTTIQEIYGDVHGTVVQAVQSQVSFNQQVTNTFKEARTLVDKKENVPSDLKKDIKRRLNLLEEELGKTEPDVGRMQKSWKWLKRNANWVVPTLTKVVLEGIKLAFGSD